MSDFFRKLNKPGLSALLALLLLAGIATAGSLTPTGAPSSTMNTLAEIFDSIAGTFDSSGVVADQNGSLIEHLKYIEENMGTGGGVGSDSLDFDEFVDEMTLDADTHIASAGFVLTTTSKFAVATRSTDFGQFVKRSLHSVRIDAKISEYVSHWISIDSQSGIAIFSMVYM